ncbi:Sortase family protein [compost metagenome]
MDYRNDIEAEQRHTLLYGHRMKDGSMFGDLKKYLNQNYYDTHRQFQLDTLNVTFNAEIFSVYYTTTDFNYLDTEFSDDESFGAFLEKIQHKSLYAKDIELTLGDRIVTLSTCDYILDPVAGRLVVHARLKRL